MTTELKAREAPASYVVESLRVRTGYKQTEVGVIPADWRVRPLGELATTIASGRSKFGATYGSFPVHGSTGVIGYCEEPEYEGDAILVARVGANAGKLNIVTGRYGVTDNTIILRVRSDSYLPFFWLQLENKRLNNLVFGSGQPLITGSQLKALAVCDPPLSEQRAIAAVLSDVDALLAKLDQLIAKKRDLKQAAMQQLLTGQTRLLGFSREWEVKRLGDVADLLKGAGLSKNSVVAFGHRKCILYGELFTTYGQVIRDVVGRTNSQDGRLSVAGDVLVPGSTTTDGIDLATASALLEDGVALGGDINVIRFKDANTFDARFLANYLTHVKKQEIAERAQGTTIVHLYGRDLSDLSLQCPDLAEQAAIATVLSDMDTEIAALEGRRDKTRALKQGMMQELLTGRIRLV